MYSSLKPYLFELIDFVFSIIIDFHGIRAPNLGWFFFKGLGIGSFNFWQEEHLPLLGLPIVWRLICLKTAAWYSSSHFFFIKRCFLLYTKCLWLMYLIEFTFLLLSFLSSSFGSRPSLVLFWMGFTHVFRSFLPKLWVIFPFHITDEKKLSLLSSTNYI